MLAGGELDQDPPLDPRHEVRLLRCGQTVPRDHQVRGPLEADQWLLRRGLRVRLGGGWTQGVETRGQGGQLHRKLSRNGTGRS